MLANCIDSWSLPFFLFTEIGGSSGIKHFLLLKKFELFKEKQEGLRPTGFTSLRWKPQSYVKEEDPTQAERSETDSVMEIYEPFLSDSDYA